MRGRKPLDLSKFPPFGRLTAIAPTGKRYHKSVVWLCRCSCGNECEASARVLVHKMKQSCGCLQREWRLIRCQKMNAVMKQRDRSRAMAMEADLTAGMRQCDVAKKHGVTKQRVSQVARKLREHMEKVDGQRPP